VLVVLWPLSAAKRLHDVIPEGDHGELMCHGQLCTVIQSERQKVGQKPNSKRATELDVGALCYFDVCAANIKPALQAASYAHYLTVFYYSWQQVFERKEGAHVAFSNIVCLPQART
jgi:hypothetical protein